MDESHPKIKGHKNRDTQKRYIIVSVIGRAETIKKRVQTGRLLIIV